ncbi:hypothetical protein D0962_23420 [Leptolyngbyaceae cyanobacterium CCMR0082]|uniref:Uncharacterized protein n=1 Tax=Adonisia turfae CCMR0082 TaxID=2304604 RepID=A0A6M0SB48_9CYAN|nr:hypothetical protein [Adonisia turfae]NEZ65670.1 hypothetical protein [Adonisia turfae CCMR0082]
MATPQLITADNALSLLVLSTEGRSGTPDGNFFPNTVTGELELIGADELAQVDLGSGLEANPLTNFDGVTKQAIYRFERQIRQTGNEDLRGSRPFTEGVFRFSGAFETVYARKIAPADIPKIRSSGIVSREQKDGPTNRIYFGVRSLNAIQATSQPFYQLVPKPVTTAGRQAASPTNFGRLGPVDELVQTFGSTVNGDTGAGDFDFTGYELIASVRTFGREYSSATASTSGAPELNGFSQGFGFGDGAPTTSADYNLVDVYGGTQIGPWTGMAYTSYDIPQTIEGFSDGAGGTRSADFSAAISNTGGGSLTEIRAFLDALMLQDTDVDQHGTNSFIPKRAEELYTIDGSVLVTRQGLYIENVAAADRPSIRFTDDSGTEQSFPQVGDVRVSVPTAWTNDAQGWYQAFTGASHNTADPVTFTDATSTNVVGTSADVVSGEIRFTVSETDLNSTIVFVIEGNGGATFDEVSIFLDPTAPIIRASVNPAAENFI